MTQGEIEKLASGQAKIFTDLQNRIMADIVRRIRINGFSTASADWQTSRLQQLGMSEKDIRSWIQEALKASDEEIERIFSDEVYEQYMGHGRAYRLSGMQQIPFEENKPLQQLVEAMKSQASQECSNLAGSMGFAIRDPSGKVAYTPLLEYYRTTLDNAVIDIKSGAFSYQTVLERTINQMTTSGLRWIDYDSGHRDRVDVAARRAVLTGFRQVQGKINEQVARDLGTDSYEVTWHGGARPSHQVWQGRVWTMKQLREVCGLGDVTGLHGANCYHDYNAFFPGISARTYTDEWLDAQNEKENTPKTYNSKEYTTYEALQEQRKMERTMRKYRMDLKLLKEGGSSEDAITLKKARYQGKMQEYEAFSKAMKLPMQKERIYQDGLGRKITQLDTDAVKAARKNLDKAKNKFGEAVIFNEKLSDDKWKASKEMLVELTKEYDTHLRAVGVGAHQAAGTMDLGGNMKLSSANVETAMHEFAHSISTEYMTKVGITDDSDFWKEIRKIRTKYRKAVENNSLAAISNYADSKNDISEFMAEAFTQAKMKELGLPIPKGYGEDFTYSQKVLELIDKYFKKKN